MSKTNLFCIIILFSSIFTPNKSTLVLGSSSPPVNGNEEVVMRMVYDRPNPLHGFKHYNGGYNITNRDYWASVAFTGVHGYAMAGIWVLGGLGLGVSLILKNCCMTSRSSNIADHSNYYYIIPFFLLLLFTCLAIIGSGFTLAANKNFFGRTKKMEESILGAAGNAHRSIRKVSRAMNEMQRLLRPYNESAFSRLNWTSRKLQRESQNIQRIVVKNRHKIDLATQILQGATTGVISINMALTVFALVLLLLHWRPGLIIFVEDACSAFKEFEQNPNNNSLNSVLPCVSQAYADHIMVEIGSTIHKFISKLNTKVQGMSQILGLSDNESESPGAVLKVCNPFSGAPNFFYDPSNCSASAIPIGDIPNVLAKFTCHQNHSSKTGPASCKGDPTKFITEALYDMAWAYTQTVQGLINVFPDLHNLTECTFVKDTFSDVVLHQCRSLKMSIKLLWVSTLSVSTVMVVLLLVWVVKMFQDRGRSFSRCSLVPRSTTVSQ
ncbi:uncharacterized protein LOC113329026 isoform X2 [Papaver somniferum]|uniref:uncharacterized protein LOC113329026 isoform X2 n=1 Tax=Papaver somniferum TaxID=3469 RepID=UPI000E704E16|nr:uncharacterized protein LOC113329026 isoform X2 [Papaver somniferum]